MKSLRARARSAHHGRFLRVAAQRLGSEYMSSSIAPYVASYFEVDIGEAQIILPALFVVNMFFSPIGAQAAQRFHPKM